MIATRSHGGYLWPAGDRQAAEAVIQQAGVHLPALLRWVPQRRFAVQAGGNVGVYPKILATHFERVLTVEPDPDNFACLRTNLTGVSNVQSLCAAFGEADGFSRLERWPGNVGAHRLIDGAAAPDRQVIPDIPIITIDALVRGPCDLIWLDVEGYEIRALKGAMMTIAREAPVIIVEDKGLTPGGRAGETVDFIKLLGYEVKEHSLRDFVLAPI